MVACTAASGCGPDEALRPLPVECAEVHTASTAQEVDGVLLLSATIVHADPRREYARLLARGQETARMEPGDTSHGVTLMGVRRDGGSLVADWCGVP